MIAIGFLPDRYFCLREDFGFGIRGDSDYKKNLNSWIATPLRTLSRNDIRVN